MFSYYAAIVKNLRGVILVRELDQLSIKILNWIAERFRYRDIGAPPGIWSEFPDEYKAKFIKLEYPINELRDLVNYLSKSLNLEAKLIESLIISSTYITPLFNIGGCYVDELDKLSVGCISIDKPLDNRSWKLHFRIADYTVLDFYRDRVIEAIEYIEGVRLGINPIKYDYIISKRMDLIKNDYKRYWRIKSDWGFTFLIYIDMLKILHDLIKEGRIRIGLLDVNHAAAFSIIPILILDRNTIANLND